MFRLMYDNAGGRSMGNPLFIPVTVGEDYFMGEALVISGGKATKCGATAKPTHICARDQAAGISDTVLIYPISATMIFEAEVTASPTKLVPGSKVTLSSDACGITATTTDGICEIVSLCGAKEVGDKLTVKF